MDWVLISFSDVFDAIGHVFLMMLLNIERFFLWVPWWLIIAFVGILAWRVMHKWTMGVVMAGLLVLIGSFGYWKMAMMTLALTTSAVVVSLAVGIPIGIFYGQERSCRNNHQANIRRHADHAQFCLSYPGADAFRPWKSAGLVRHAYLTRSHLSYALPTWEYGRYHKTP